MATDITLKMCIEELERTVASRKTMYPQLVNNGKMTPYTRDKRINIMQRLLELCKNAQKNKSETLFSSLKKLPE